MTYEELTVSLGEDLTEQETRYFIFNIDPGTDDAWALWMLLKSETQFNIKILAITCSAGNSSLSNVATNTIRILELANRTDVIKSIQINSKKYLHIS